MLGKVGEPCSNHFALSTESIGALKPPLYPYTDLLKTAMTSGATPEREKKLSWIVPLLVRG